MPIDVGDLEKRYYTTKEREIKNFLKKNSDKAYDEVEIVNEITKPEEDVPSSGILGILDIIKAIYRFFTTGTTLNKMVTEGKIKKKTDEDGKEYYYAK